jgi:hypothetical protein
MNLNEIVSSGQQVAVPLIGADKALATDVQNCLTAIGLLDPPADGVFGPVSHWALAQFARRLGIRGTPVLDAAFANALLEGDESDLFPLNATATLAGRVAAALTSARHWICRHPSCMNLVYVEGMDADGSPNGDTPNVFNDLRLVLRINRAGNPDIVEAWEATTEPGGYYTVVEKLDPRGAARIAFGQYKAWSVGTHMAGRKSAHEALVQTAPVRVHRDFNADFERIGDKVTAGVFGINQHWGYDLPKSDIGRASAGCLVGRTKTGHRSFMRLCKSDPRYVASNGYRFMTAVLPATAIAPDNHTESSWQARRRRENVLQQRSATAARRARNPRRRRRR